MQASYSGDLYHGTLQIRIVLNYWERIKTSYARNWVKSGMCIPRLQEVFGKFLESVSSECFVRNIPKDVMSERL